MTFSIEGDHRQGSGSKRMCKRHGRNLRKHMKPDGTIIWTCPREKCGYRENEDGEKI